MSWFKRRHGHGGYRAEASLADAVAPVLPGKCSEKGCLELPWARCTYIDRRSRRCPTQWCHLHGMVINNATYCRRHANTLFAISNSLYAQSLPDVENRGPSLVSWVAAEVDEKIKEILGAYAPAYPGVVLVVDPLVLVFAGRDRRRIWERAWKLSTHTGTPLRVALMVDEADDAKLKVKVGSKVVFQQIPPWITNRRQDFEVGADEDAAQRTAFYESVIRVVHDGLHEEHEIQLTTMAQEAAVAAAERARG